MGIFEIAIRAGGFSSISDNISGGSEAQLERFAIPIRSLTAERGIAPNAPENITPAVISNIEKTTMQKMTRLL